MGRARYRLHGWRNRYAGRGRSGVWEAESSATIVGCGEDEIITLPKDVDELFSFLLDMKCLLAVLVMSHFDGVPRH